MKHHFTGKAAIILVLSFITLATLYLASELYRNSETDKKYKEDYFTVNQIKYGLLSGDNWGLQVNRIVSQQVDSFTFSPENKKLLTDQVGQILDRLMSEADAVMHKDRHTLKERIRFKVLNTLVDVRDFKAEIPRFSKAIVDELENSKNKEQLKALLKEKINGILAVTSQKAGGEQGRILREYDFSSIAAFNQYIFILTNYIKDAQQRLGFMLIGLLLANLLLWFFVIRSGLLLPLTFLFSALISFMALYIGISLPMIEIDARIATLDLKLLSGHIIFNDQIIFFRTKSILDVIGILVRNGKPDAVFVGCLIFLFSVLFPVSKLIAAVIHLFVKEKSNAFIRYMAFKSGKWSMADVMVVAIFMAYVGFRSILNDQLDDLNMQKDVINMISTNKSNLQTGFMIFVSFVLFNLALAEILKYITRPNGRIKQLDINKKAA